MKTATIPTNREVFFDRDHFIVSKTDLKGRITYVNRAFCKVASYTERELIGAQHSIVRHPDMPRVVFKFLWDRILEGNEVFAYVKNMTKNGDFYWVFAHVTPSCDPAGNFLGFHSNRRAPDRRVLNEAIIPLYAALLKTETETPNAKQGLAASYRQFSEIVQGKARSYDELVFSL
ncbi:PAS domain S-box protein [Rhodoblastus acidophilus]|jgi:PAS domain S-box-containing protein|uniref:PAS domain S-box protein n=1 Tax=Rhodoblastus acidophilus TaxID=1074 RepID=A0A6N8DSF2_RHOAC|nr:PAS domain-containing protein [Rhodoblastus acidophilus]MCW2275626.1 PAS domain S-box-containing protein [Rhodoblastus acidophilus]MTV32123.1 PAS domain S-box protein [Rhodoblastus acidophilus]